jgi:hypothetical protein
MALDEDILRDVEAARDRLDALEDETYEARATLHQAIRRLHAAGGSMREIATALGMSHQRVHQIIGTDGIVEVEASAVTDVSPLPTTVAGTGPSTTTAVAVTAGEDACSFCGAPRRELDKLFAAPGPVFICGGCVAAANLAVQSREAKGFRSVPVDEDATCSFCGNASAVGGVMAEAEAGSPRICSRCTETCRKLVTQRDPARAMTRRSNKIRCSFCNVSQTDTKRLIAGPGVYICEGCVATAGDVVATATPAKGPRQVVLRPAITEDHECSFCEKPPAQVAQLATGGRARICDECVQLCCDILDEAG